MLLSLSERASINSYGKDLGIYAEMMNTDSAKENDMQFDVQEPVHQVEEQDVDGNAQHIDAWMVYLTKKIMKKGNPEYALVDSYFFIYFENLWKNWDPDFEPDPNQPSKIPEELMNYVWGLNPKWGI
ncbi:hypothetical protein Dimus_018837 [Dionaea muscipula]